MTDHSRRQYRVAVIAAIIDEVGQILVDNVMVVLAPLCRELNALMVDDRPQGSADKRRSWSFLGRLTRMLLLQTKLSMNLMRASSSYDIVIVHAGGYWLVLPVLLAKALRKKVILLHLGGDKLLEEEVNAGSALSRFVIACLVQTFMKLTYSTADMIACESSRVTELRSLREYRRKIFTVGGRCLDTSLFNDRTPLEGREKKVGYVGAFRPVKGIVNFLKCVPLVLRETDANFHVAGEGYLRPRVESEINALPSSERRRVVLTRWVDHQSLPALLNSLRVLVLPSYSEGVPGIVQEAMACGTVVVATPVGGIPDLIRDNETGIIATNNSAECLARNIKRALTCAPEVTKRARELIEEQYSRESVTERYAGMLNLLQMRSGISRTIRRMRIVILHREYPPNTMFVSTSLLYQRMAKAFVNKGHEVHVICQSTGQPIDRDDGGVHVHEVGSNLRRGSARARISYSIAAWRKLRELGEVDIVNAEFFLGEGLLYSLTKRKTPLVLQAHAWSEGWLESSGLLGSTRRSMAAYLEKITARRANKIIATSQATFDWLTTKAGLPEDRVCVVYEFVDTATYKPVKSDLRVRLGIPDNSRLVLFVASLEPRKGPRVLADAIPHVLAHVPQTKFLFIGRDMNLAPGGSSMRSFIEHIAQEGNFKDNIIFTGMVPISEVVEAYSACDIFVYPGFKEAGGLPPVEAMACNCPVVATATGTAKELEGVTPAFQVAPPGDPEALAEKIIQLLSMPPARLKQFASGHRTIVEERFNFDQMVNKLLSVYEEVIC